MKIDTEVYAPSLREKFRDNAIVIEEILAFINDHLPCSSCKSMLPKECFVRSSVFANRDGRYTVCKKCVKNSRTR